MSIECIEAGNDWRSIEGASYYTFGTEAPETLLFGGLSVGQFALRKAVEYLGANGYNTAAVLLEYQDIDSMSTSESIEYAHGKVLGDLISDINNIFDLPEATPKNVAGESGGASVAVDAAYKLNERIGNVVVSGPFGFNNSALGEGRKARYKEFSARLRGFINKPAEHEDLVTKETQGMDLKTGKRITHVLEMDRPEKIIRAIAESHQLTIICWDEDKIIKPEEVQAEIANIDGVLFRIESGNHPSLNTKAGQMQMKKAFDLSPIMN